MNIGDKIVLDNGDITGEVIAVSDSTHQIHWATGHTFTYSNDVEWNDENDEDEHFLACKLAEEMNEPTYTPGLDD